MGPYIKYRHDFTHDVDHVRKSPRLSLRFSFGAGSKRSYAYLLRKRRESLGTRLVCGVFISHLCQSSMRDVTELQQQLQSSSQQLRRKEAELTRAQETIRREQQQIQEMRQQVRVQTCGANHIYTMVLYLCV